jgi:hypothetical protein
MNFDHAFAALIVATLLLGLRSTGGPARILARASRRKRSRARMD